MLVSINLIEVLKFYLLGGVIAVIIGNTYFFITKKAKIEFKSCVRLFFMSWCIPVLLIAELKGDLVRYLIYTKGKNIKCRVIGLIIKGGNNFENLLTKALKMSINEKLKKRFNYEQRQILLRKNGYNTMYDEVEEDWIDERAEKLKNRIMKKRFWK